MLEGREDLWDLRSLGASKYFADQCAALRGPVPSACSLEAGGTHGIQAEYQKHTSILLVKEGRQLE